MIEHGEQPLHCVTNMYSLDDKGSRCRQKLREGR